MSGYLKAFYTEDDNETIKIDMGLLGMLIVITSAAFVISLQINGVFQEGVKFAVSKFKAKVVENGVTKTTALAPLISLITTIVVILAMLGLIWGIVTLYSRNNAERLKHVLPQAHKKDKTTGESN
jgi:hypothetical protein